MWSHVVCRYLLMIHKDVLPPPPWYKSIAWETEKRSQVLPYFFLHPFHIFPWLAYYSTLKMKAEHSLKHQQISTTLRGITSWKTVKFKWILIPSLAKVHTMQFSRLMWYFFTTRVYYAFIICYSALWKCIISSRMQVICHNRILCSNFYFTHRNMSPCPIFLIFPQMC